MAKVKKSQKPLRVVVPRRSKEEESANEAFRRFREAVNRLHENDERRREALGRGERDDLPRVTIPTPVVRPKGVSTQKIRKAVRKAVQEYSERRAKSGDKA